MRMAGMRMARGISAARWCAAPMLVCAVAGSAYPAPIGDPSQHPGASFFERFDHVNPRAWEISDGWTNGDHQGCKWSKNRVRIESDRLVLALERIPSGAPVYQCGEIQSRGFYHYGTFEVRMRAARASGINSAFFTYVGPTHGQPHDEIDFEVLGRNTREVQVNTFVSGKDGQGKIVPNGVDVADEFVDYAFEWTPDRVRWFVNGKLTREASGPEVPSHAAKIYLSIWNGHGLDAWLGRFEVPEEPLKMFVEYVAFTAPGDPCQFPSSIVCSQRAPEGR
jgi:endo-1,3-1,4-beta-glycanase ExoK